jgi:hypothetical protein
LSRDLLIFKRSRDKLAPTGSLHPAVFTVSFSALVVGKAPQHATNCRRSYSLLIERSIKTK